MNEFLLNDTPIKVWAKYVDPHAWQEIDNLSRLPFIYHHLAFMPDVHGGMGMPIGGVLASEKAVVPNAVGVDIGCGMCAVKTNIMASDISKEIIRKDIMSRIRQRIPLGMEHHKELQDESFMPQGHDIDKLQVVGRQYVSARRQVGTLGGGNHFIELQKDDEGHLWIMLHSGSRNLGKQVGEHYNKIAKELNAMYHSAVNPSWQMHFLPLGSKEFTAYWKEMSYCVDFALCNRKLMMNRIMEIVADALPQVEFGQIINIAHNYASWEHHYGNDVIVHRKGAVRAMAGETGIIPGSQGTSSYIVEGLGCPESFMSSSHGAGRTMSRTEAIKTLSLKKEIEMLDSKDIIHGIRSQNHLDEAAGAYKNIDEVMANQQDLVKIITKLSPLAVIKG